MIRTLLIAGTGGFIGTILRYLVQILSERLMHSIFPLGTMVVNITGSFIIGVIFAFAEKGNLMGPDWRIFLAVGICGGFTTFSTFSMDSLNLLKDNSIFQFLFYSAGSVVLGLAAVYLGILLVRSLI